MKFETPNGHIVLEQEGKKFLMDTGSPVSIGTGDFVFAGKKWSAHENVGPASVKDLTGFVGKDFDYLLGNDVIGKFHWTIDWDKKEIAFFDGYGNNAPEGVPSIETDFMGCPTTKIRLFDGSETAEALIDTGAPIMYGPEDRVKKGVYAGTKRDFSPFYGYFETDIYRIPMEFMGEWGEYEFGILPARLSSPMATMGKRWVLGPDVLKKRPIHFRVTPFRMIFFL